MRPRRGIAVLLAVCAVVGVAGVLLSSLFDGGAEAVWAELGAATTMLGFGLIGSLLAWHRPTNRIGWLMVGFAATLAIRGVIEQSISTVSPDAVTVWTRMMVFGTSVLEGVGIGLLVTLAVVFPQGGFASERWRRAIAMVWGLASLHVLASPFSQYRNGDEVLPSIWPISGLSDVLWALSLPAVIVLGAAMVRIIRLRFRGSDVERRQIRLVSYVVAITLALIAAAGFVEGAGDAASFVVGLGAPAAIAVAVSRYRLYEIDRILSRTIGYAVVLVLLAGAFGIIVAVPVVVVGSDQTPAWLVAMATLVVFTLFSPLHRRLQRAVDRRFNRASYDAVQVAEGFAGTIRDGADLGSIAESLRRIAGDVFQPTVVGLWVKHDGAATASGARRSP